MTMAAIIIDVIMEILIIDNVIMETVVIGTPIIRIMIHLLEHHHRTDHD